MNRRVIASAVCAFSMFVCVASSAQAANLAPGGTVPLPGTTLGADPTLAGTVIASTPVTPFVGVDNLNVWRSTGTMEPHGVLEADTNTVSIYYQVHNNANSLDPIGQLTNTDFGGWTTDVHYPLDAMVGIVGGSVFPGTQSATEATRSAGAGGQVRFHFIGAPIGNGELAQGTTSLWHVVRTNAPACTLGNTAVINGGNVNVVTFAPIPEPATFGLLGLGALSLLRRRR